MKVVDLDTVGLDEGGGLLIARALRTVAPSEGVAVRGASPMLEVHLRGWCRARGHTLSVREGELPVVVRGTADTGRWRDAEQTGSARDVVSLAPQYWGLAGRSATVERGGPAFDFALTERREVWFDDAARLYAQAVAAQWDPATAIPWDSPTDLPDDVEDAVVQVMTYLIENETAALIIPARFAARVHPHYREVLQLLAIQAADEARHIEVFTRRALLHRPRLALSTSGGQASLKTLLDEPDFALASLLLSVLGEGSFLSLLWFLHRHGPDPVTREVARLAAQDEARHVAFGLGHLSQHAREDPGLLARLALAVERRHDVLANTSGLNEEVHDALVVLAAGAWDPASIRDGYRRVDLLRNEMHEGRRKRLVRLGFEPSRADALAALHTRNFM